MARTGHTAKGQWLENSVFSDLLLDSSLSWNDQKKPEPLPDRVRKGKTDSKPRGSIVKRTPISSG